MTPSQNDNNESLEYIGFDEETVNAEKNKKKREKSEKKKQRKKARHNAIVFLGLAVPSVILSFAIAAIAMVAVGKGQMLRTADASPVLPDIAEIAAENDGKTVTYAGETYRLNENVTSILCMGIDRNGLGDSGGYGGNGQSDANVLLTIDTKTGRVCMIAISRDTMVNVNVYSESGAFAGSQKQQLCLAFANGDGSKESCTNMMRSVSSLFYGIPIETYMAIDLDAIGILNSAVGGVFVTPNESFTYSGYSFVKGQKTLLDTAVKAEGYVRMRDITRLDSNTQRMQRQKEYLLAWAKAAVNKTKKNITFPVSLYNMVSGYDINNLNISKISYLTSVVIGNGRNVKLEFKSVEGKVTQGEQYAEFIPDEQKLLELVLDVFYTKR